MGCRSAAAEGSGSRGELRYTAPVLFRRLIVGAPIALLVLALFVALSACPASQQGIEQPESCLDGKDNDGDGLVDCDDPDCRRLAICGSPQRRDGGPVLIDGPPPPSDGPTPDKGTPKRDLTPPPPPTSYGQTCSNISSLCPDGKTKCVLSLYSSAGYCSKPCTKGSACEASPAGTPAYCVHGFNGTYYCSFTCKWNNEPFSCPAGFDCYAWTSSQSQCFP